MRRALTTSLVLLAVAGWARAEEKRAPAEDAINAARRDLDLIKASRDRTALPKGDVPRLSVPELQAGSPAPAPLPAQKSRIAEKEKDKKSKNWLVEAMDRKSDERGVRGKSRGDERRGKTDEDDLPNERRIDREQLVGRDARAAKEERYESERRPEPVANPLTQYAADWMTPQDFALMRLVLAGSGAGEFGPASNNGAAGPAGSFSGAAAPGAIDSTSDAFGVGKTFSPSTPQENPYLQAINSSPAALPVWTPPPASSPSTLISPATPPTAAPAVPPPAKTKIPDFVKPANDEKYFKPLKRF